MSIQADENTLAGTLFCEFHRTFKFSNCTCDILALQMHDPFGHSIYVCACVRRSTMKL